MGMTYFYRNLSNLNHYCRVCNTQLNSCKQVKIHISGKKHQKRFNYLKYSIDTGKFNILLLHSSCHSPLALISHQQPRDKGLLLRFSTIRTCTIFKSSSNVNVVIKDVLPFQLQLKTMFLKPPLQVNHLPWLSVSLCKVNTTRFQMDSRPIVK